ncbi:MAG: hypothetical protein WCT23_09655 [Candidatus Neomarinimicrobiota bacterium]
MQQQTKRPVRQKSKEYYQFINSLDRTYNENDIKDAIKEDLDLNHEWWEKMSYVEKPQYLVKKEQHEENLRKGYLVQEEFTPLEDCFFVLIDDINKNNKIVIASDKYKPDTNSGIIIKSSNKKYEINKRVFFNASKITKRFNYRNNIYLVMSEKDLVGIDG